jgi:hypothetical protein
VTTISSNLDRLIGAAARRVLVRRALRRGALGLAGGAGGGLVLLAADRAAGLPMSGAAYVVVVTLGLIGGVVTALWPRPPRLPVATRLDRGLHLHDRLGTALAVERADDPRRHDAAFAALVRRDADRVAARLDARSVTPIGIDRAWTLALALVGVLALGLWLIPDMPWTKPARTLATAMRAEDEQRDRAALAETINQAVEDVLPPDDEEPPVLDAAMQAEVDALRSLADQLTGDPADDEEQRSADDARSASAGHLNELAEQLGGAAEREAAAVDELTRRFEGMTPPDDEQVTGELRDALQRGAFGEAGAALEDLVDAAAEMTDEDRQTTLRELEQLAREIEQTAATPGTADERLDALRRALAEQGLDEQTIDDLVGEPDPVAEDSDAVADALRDRNIDEEIARELARAVDDVREREALDERVARDTQALADALDEAAGDITEPEAAPPEPPAEDASEPDASETPPPTGEPPTEDAVPPDTGQREDARQREGTEQPQGAERTQRSEQRDGAEQTQGTEQRDGAEQTQGAEQREGTEQTQGAEQREGAEETQGAEQREGTEQTQGAEQPPEGTEQRDGAAEPQETEQPGDRTAGAIESGEAAGDEPDAERGARRSAASDPSPSDAFREIEDRRRAADRNRETAERARETARRLAENMSDEERRQWVERWRRQGSTGGRDLPGLGAAAADSTYAPDAGEVVDAGADEGIGEPVAEWFGDEPTPSTLDGAAPGTMAGRVRRARRDAERAVNESAVPPRYHRFIRQYFDRLERSKGPTTETAPPARGEPSAGSGDAKP